MALTREEAFLNAYMQNLRGKQKTTVSSAEKKMSGAASVGANRIERSSVAADVPAFRGLKAAELANIQKAATAAALETMRFSKKAYANSARDKEKESSSAEKKPADKSALNTTTEKRTAAQPAAQKSVQKLAQNDAAIRDVLQKSTIAPARGKAQTWLQNTNKVNIAGIPRVTMQQQVDASAKMAAEKEARLKERAARTRTWTAADRERATLTALEQQKALADRYSTTAYSNAQKNALSIPEQLGLFAGNLGIAATKGMGVLSRLAPVAPELKKLDTAQALSYMLEQRLLPMTQRENALHQQRDALAYHKMEQTRLALEQSARETENFDPANTAGASEEYTGGSPMKSALLPVLDALSLAGMASDSTLPVQSAEKYGIEPQPSTVTKHGLVQEDSLAPATEYMTDEQRAVYNHYAGSGQPEKAAQYKNALSYATDAAKVAEQSDIASKTGADGGLGMAYTAAMHLAGQAGSPLALLETIGQTTGNAISGNYMPLNKNSRIMAAQALPDAVMGGFQSNLTPAQKQAANIATSIVDNVGNVMLFGPLSPAVMAAQSGGRGAYEATQNGASPAQALASGVTQGAAEYLGEKFSFGMLDSMLHGAKAKSIKDFAMAAGAQMANEFSEESATEVMNILSDVAIMRDKSDVAQYVQDYMAARGDSTQAQQDIAVALYCAKRVGGAGLAGAITGGVLGSGAQMINARGYRQQSGTGKDAPSAENVETPFWQAPVSTEAAMNPGAARGVPEVPYLRNTQPPIEQSRTEVPYVKSPAPGNPLDNTMAEQYIKNNRVDALRGSVPVVQNSTENLTGFPVLKGTERDGTVSTENAAERDYGRGIDGGAEPGGAGGSVVGAEPGSFPAVPQGLFRQPVNNEKTNAGYLRAGAGVQDFRDTTGNAEEFCRALDSARKENKFGLMVSDKTPQTLAESGAITFMSRDGLSGAAVTRDGDIEAVFKNPRSKVAKASYQMVITAVENGGVKLDCYGCALAKNYAKIGFEPVARIPWDGDSAEAGWTYGEHDVYAMKLMNGVTAEEIADKLGLSEVEGGFHMPTDEELAALPTFTDYEKALEYRDSLLPERAVPMKQSSASIKEIPHLKNAPQKQSGAGIEEIPYLKSVPQKEAQAVPEIPYLKPPKENTVGAKESAYRHDVKTSAVQSNTFANTPMFTQAQKAVAGLDDAGEFQYDAVSEAESMDKAAQRMELDPDGERADLMESRKEWIGEDVDTSMLILEDEMKKAEASGNYGEVLKWAKKIQQSGTKAGQLVQSFAKYSRTPAGGIIEAQQTVDAVEREIKEKAPKKIKTADAECKAVQDVIAKAKTKKEIAAKLESMFRERVPRGRKSTKEKVLEMVEMGAYSDADLRSIIKERNGIPVLTVEDASKITQYLENAQNAKEGSYDRRMWESRADQIIADKLPATFRDKFRGLQRISMILNPRTLITRNPLGNVVLGVAENIKDAPGTLIDAITGKFTGERTTSLSLKGIAAQGKGFAKGLSEWGMDVKNKTDTSPSRGQAELPNKRIFKSDFLNSIDQFERYALELGDRPFYQAAYDGRMAELKRLGKTGEEAEVDAKLFALDRVFQNNSALSKRAGEVRRALGLPGDVIAPFTQTPANVMDKLLDYSPAGLAKAMAELGRGTRDGNFNQKLFVDRLSRTFTGTGILMIGFALAKAGLATGALDKDNDVRNAQYNAGMQPYSIKIGDNYYSYEWAQPIGGLLAAGIDAYQAGIEKKDFVGMICEGGKSALNTMFRQSFLSGVFDLLSGYSPADGILASALGATSQLTPSAMASFAKVIDPVMRETYDPNPIAQQAKRMQARIPFLSKTLPEKINSMGVPALQSQGRGSAARAVENLLSPGKYTTTQKDKVNDEALRLYKAIGDSARQAALPSAEKNVNSGALTANQFNALAKAQGVLQYENAAKLLDSHIYKSADDYEKVDLLKAIYQASSVIAKKQTISGYTVPSTHEKVLSAYERHIDPYLYYSIRWEADKDKDGSIRQDELKPVLDASGLTQSEKAFLWKLQNASWKSNPYG